jgi:hypothetical protein
MRKLYLLEAGKAGRAARGSGVPRFCAVLAAIVCGLVVLGAPATAQTTAVYGGNPDHIDLAIPVTASIAVSCSFATAPAGTFSAGEISPGFSHDFPFTVACNTPFRVAVVSQNGGLSAPVTPPPGYAAAAPYDIRLALVGDTGVVPVNATCTAASLSAASPSPCAFRGPASAVSGLMLGGRSSGVAGSYLRVSAPVYRGVTLIASPDYRDVLIVTLAAST